MNRNIIIFIIISNLFFNVGFGQNNDTKIEITETDITSFSNIKSDQISVFDITLGMSTNEVIEILRKNKNLYFERDNKTTDKFRIYVSDKKEVFNNNIIYLIWSDNFESLNRIVFFQNFAKYLKGNSSKLLTFEGFDTNSKLSQNFLGYPNKIETNDKLISLGLEQTTYYYFSKGIKITLNDDTNKKSVVFSFYLTN